MARLKEGGREDDVATWCIGMGISRSDRGGELEVYSVQWTSVWGDKISLHKYIRGQGYIYWEGEPFELNDDHASGEQGG